MERTFEDIEKSLIELMDESYELITIGDFTFTASDIISSCDPVAWREMVNDHEDYMNESDE